MSCPRAVMRMGSEQPPKKEMESKIAPDTVLEVDTPNSSGQGQKEMAAVKHRSYLKGARKFLRRILGALLLMCIGPPLAVVLYTLCPIVTVVVCLVSLVALRLLQIICHGRLYDNVIRLKIRLRNFILAIMEGILILLGILYPIAKYSHGLKEVVLLDLRITSWIHMISMLIGFCYLSQVVALIVSYLIPRFPLEFNENGRQVREALSEIFDCLLFRWAEHEVVKHVSVFKDDKMLGLYTRKWIDASLYILIGSNIITLSTHMIVWNLRKTCQYIHKEDSPKKWPYRLIGKYVFYAAIGMKRSIDLLLSSALILLIWLFCFRSHLNGTPLAKRISRYVTSTCVSVSIFWFMWLIKTSVLLYWEARVVCSRLRDKIIKLGPQLYFLGLLSYRKDHKDLGLFEEPVLNRRRFPAHYIGRIHSGIKKIYRKDDTSSNFEHCLLLWCLPCCCAGLDVGPVDMKGKDKRKRRVKEILIGKDSKETLYDIHQITMYFLATKEFLLREQCIAPQDLDCLNNDGRFEDNLRQLIESDDWEKFMEMLPKEKPPEEKLPEEMRPEEMLPEEKLPEEMLPEEMLPEEMLSKEMLPEGVLVTRIQTWKERARQNCLVLANTLSSSQEVGNSLNKVLFCTFMGITILLWLLLTGLATTKVLVLIASQLLAASFIFGDTFKTLFQGLIFVYVANSFDVGDLCSVDEKLMEVKAISVWRTTFKKVQSIGMQDEVIYPNSELANKSIVNYKTNFDWNDHLEFNVGSIGEARKVQDLQKEILRYLDDKKDLFVPDSHSVLVLPSGDNIKISVQFKHKPNKRIEDGTYIECLKEKDKLRSEFAFYVQNLLEKAQNKESNTSASKSEETTQDVGNCVEKGNNIIEG